MKKIALYLLLFVFAFQTVISIKLPITLPWNKEPEKQGTDRGIFIDLPNNSRIIVLQNDMFALKQFIKKECNQENYAIVNAANTVLYLGTGVAGKIKELDRSGTVQKECDNLREKQGVQVQVKKKIQEIPFFRTYEKSFPVSTAVTTGSGDLKELGITKIIHAIAPNCNENGSAHERNNFEAYLDKTYQTIISAMIHKELPVVACPSLATGTFRCDLAKSARIAAQVVVSALNGSKEPKTFILVAFGDAEFKSYSEAFKTEYRNVIEREKLSIVANQ
ncbi:macro domain-containing protein [bacterium]|nr:MAG: macro domain-containing protein [bacterium]QQR61498.1 MAG: macro domain-containing protein [bacterium]QQR62974.1 MAG: macro domain-containing protein [bacterium]